MTFKWELESHNRTCITRVPRGHGWASGFESEWKNEGSDKGNTRNISSISVQFSHSVVFDSLRPHGLQHARLPCPSAMPVACSNSCPLSWWWHPTNLSSVIPLLLLPSIFTSIKVFSNESVLYIKWPKYWSFTFSISPSNEHSGLISFRMDWSPCSPRDSQESYQTTQFKSINSLALSFLQPNSHIRAWLLEKP